MLATVDVREFDRMVIVRAAALQDLVDLVDMVIDRDVALPGWLVAQLRSTIADIRCHVVPEP